MKLFTPKQNLSDIINMKISAMNKMNIHGEMVKRTWSLINYFQFLIWQVFSDLFGNSLHVILIIFLGGWQNKMTYHEVFDRSVKHGTFVVSLSNQLQEIFTRPFDLERNEIRHFLFTSLLYVLPVWHFANFIMNTEMSTNCFQSITASFTWMTL